MTITKTTLAAAVSAIALTAAAPALATDAGKTMAPAGHTSAAAQMTAGAQIKADDLIGKDILNLSGDTVGDVESVIIDGNGKVAAVIVGVGGFLGLGEREVAIDWNDLRIRQNGEIVQTNLTKNDLKALPEYTFKTADNRQRSFVDQTYLDDRAALAENRRDEPMDKTDGQMADHDAWIEAQGLRISKLIGADVVNAAGETIGEVEDLIVENGQTRLILSVGEFLGMGGREVALDLDQARFQHQRDDRDDLRVSLSMTKDELKAMPEYKADRSGMQK